MGLSEVLDPPGERATDKAHVTDLIARVLGDKRGDFASLPQNVHNIMAMGRIWESVVRVDVAKAALDVGLVPSGPQVLELDGIIGSLDGSVCDLEHGMVIPKCVVEVKCRFSPASNPRDNKRYMYQGKSYCWMLGVEELWMPILNISTRPPNAEYVLYKMRFSRLELEENWRMLVNMKEYVDASK